MQRRATSKGRLFFFFLSAMVIGVIALSIEGVITLPSSPIARINSASNIQIAPEILPTQPPQIIEIIIVQTPTPLPPTPVPKSTPIPTPIPTPTVNISGTIGPGGKWDQVYRLWAARIGVLITVLYTAFVIGYAIYIAVNTKKFIALLEHERLLEELEVERQSFAKPDRPIITNTGAGIVSDTKIYLKSGKKINRQIVIDFVREVRGVGLSISKWKTEEKFAQTDIENILDHLADSNVITPRRNGIACGWLTEAKPPPMNYLARIFGLLRADVLK